MLARAAVAFLGLSVPMHAACGSDERPATPIASLDAGGGDGAASIVQGDGGGTAPCAATTVVANATKRPVDIVLIADTSSSMGAAVAAVEQNINVNFAQILLQSGIDFRVIALADVTELCVGPPLGGATCGQPGPSFFPVDLPTGSGNGLSAPIAGYATWSVHLRTGAYKVILQLSDTTSTSSMSAAEFDAALLAMSPPLFGTPGARDYAYHGILGLPAKTPVTEPWLPSEPVLTGGCNANGLQGSAQAAYQDLAILTGGLRYPLCEPAHYDVVFKKVADSVIAGSVLECSLTKPTATSGTIDPATLVVRYTPGASAAQRFEQVEDQGACKPGAFYVTPATIELCPQTCAVVQSDVSAKLDIEYGCPPDIR